MTGLRHIFDALCFAFIETELNKQKGRREILVALSFLLLSSGGVFLFLFVVAYSRFLFAL